MDLPLKCLLFVLLLGGCTSYLKQGQEYIDQSGAVSARGPCLVTEGTVARMSEFRRFVLRAYADVFCGRIE